MGYFFKFCTTKKFSKNRELVIRLKKDKKNEKIFKKGVDKGDERGYKA